MITIKGIKADGTLVDIKEGDDLSNFVSIQETRTYSVEYWKKGDEIRRAFREAHEDAAQDLFSEMGKVLLGKK